MIGVYRDKRTRHATGRPPDPRQTPQAFDHCGREQKLFVELFACIFLRWALALSYSRRSARSRQRCEVDPDRPCRSSLHAGVAHGRCYRSLRYSRTDVSHRAWRARFTCQIDIGDAFEPRQPLRADRGPRAVARRRFRWRRFASGWSRALGAASLGAAADEFLSRISCTMIPRTKVGNQRVARAGRVPAGAAPFAHRSHRDRGSGF